MVFQVMIVAGVAEMKAKLSEFLARVRAGDEVLITDHGRPVAKIVPVSDWGEELAELERAGLVRAGPMRLPKGFLDLPRPEISGPGLAEAITEERREGR
jgi:prevent-host-death family protein